MTADGDDVSSVLVTGAAGVLGREVCGLLAARGFDVVAFDRRVPDGATAAGRGAAVCWIEGDVLNERELARTFQAHRCRHVVHLAAQVASFANRNPSQGAAVNIQGTVNLLEAARTNGCRGFVFVSSRSVFGRVGGLYAHPHYKPVGEDHACRPCGIYAVTKFSAECLVREYGRGFNLDTTVLRFGALFGPGKTGNHGSSRVFSEVIEACNAGTAPVLGGAEQCEDFVYTPDAARAICLGLEAGGGDRVFNIGSGLAVSLRQFAETVTTLTGTPVRLEPGIGLMGRHFRESFLMDCRKVREGLGYRPQYDLTAGVAHYLAQLNGRHDRDVRR